MKAMTRWLILALAPLAVSAQAGTVEQAIARSGRLPADIERDARSRPQAVIPLLALEPGDRVADVFGGSGYYSELLATVVSPGGEVLLHNNAAYRHFVAGALSERFEGRDPGPITQLDSEADNLKLGQGSLDAALIIMSYHDLFYDDAANGWPQIDDADFIGQIFTALKPGGRFLIVDHAAAAGTGAATTESLHRIDEAFAIKRLTSQGFRLVAFSEALRNPGDNHTMLVFDEAIRGRTDRFILVFEKPGD
jgi:predicted methyltransferase